MKFSIANIKSIYTNCKFVGLFIDGVDDPYGIAVVKDNTIIALYDSVWSDDFKTTQYEMTLDFDKIGCKIYKLISQIKKEGDAFKYL